MVGNGPAANAREFAAKTGANHKRIERKAKILFVEGFSRSKFYPSDHESVKAPLAIWQERNKVGRMLQTVLQTIDARKSQCASELRELLAIPSVSAKPEHQEDMRQCAQWLADRLSSAKLDATVLPTGGHPVVLAKNKHVAGRPTVLVYAHYDVQPVEPLDLWTTPPFEATIRNNAIYARGAADDKGQLWAHVEAVVAWQGHGGLPINLTLLIEGEEEIGSDHLAEFVRSHQKELKADIAVISDTNQFAPGIPAITYGLRGLVYMEVTVTAAGHDLHSGLYGGSVPNSANVLVKLLATLHDEEGRVTVPGFYDKVLPLQDDEKKMWAKLPFDEKAYAAEVKIPSLSGEVGFTTLERCWVRPTCDINGLTSGYQGPGAKTVIPAKASAKVSMRLVPQQDPIAIRDAFAKAMRDRTPKNVSVEVSCHSFTPAVLVPIHGPAMELASEAVEIGFGKRPTLIRGGGSIPVVELIKSVLGIDTLLIGFGLPDDRVHSPNEKFDLDSLHHGARTAAALYERLARLTGLH
jgi:acetylornithine deacetylase/succinyl-diaminopimelate desuccinylase-like protein